MIRALLVDDDPDLARLLTDYLGSHEVEVTHVLDGPRSLAARGARAFDVVLLASCFPGSTASRSAAASASGPAISARARASGVRRDGRPHRPRGARAA